MARLKRVEASTLLGCVGTVLWLAVPFPKLQTSQALRQSRDFGRARSRTSCRCWEGLAKLQRTSLTPSPSAALGGGLREAGNVPCNVQRCSTALCIFKAEGENDLVYLTWCNSRQRQEQ